MLAPRPEGLTLDRIRSAGNYEPGNVRWATYKEQARNTRRNLLVLIGEEKVSLADACERLGYIYGTAIDNIKRNGRYREITRV